MEIKQVESAAREAEFKKLQVGLVRGPANPFRKSSRCRS